MNKLFYAIGIAVATTLSATTKELKSHHDEKNTNKIEIIEELPMVQPSDSLKIIPEQ